MWTTKHLGISSWYHLRSTNGNAVSGAKGHRWGPEAQQVWNVQFNPFFPEQSASRIDSPWRLFPLAVCSTSVTIPKKLRFTDRRALDLTLPFPQPGHRVKSPGLDFPQASLLLPRPSRLWLLPAPGGPVIAWLPDRPPGLRRERARPGRGRTSSRQSHQESALPALRRAPRWRTWRSSSRHTAQ